MAASWGRDGCSHMSHSAGRLCSQFRRNDIDQQRRILAASYGSHVPLRMQMESQIFSQFRRLPTLESSMVGLDTLARPLRPLRPPPLERCMAAPYRVICRRQACVQPVKPGPCWPKSGGAWSHELRVVCCCFTGRPRHEVRHGGPLLCAPHPPQSSTRQGARVLPGSVPRCTSLRAGAVVRRRRPTASPLPPPWPRRR